MPPGGLSLDISDGLTPAQAELIAAFQRADVRLVMGRAIRQVIVDHLFALDAGRHREEVAIHFYANAARSVQQPNVGGDGLILSINSAGIAQRYFGGTITAGANGSGVKWLTIPAVPQAMGRRAGEFTNLKFIFFGRRRDLAALVSQDETQLSLRRGPTATKTRGYALTPREDGRPNVIFWLKQSVTQQPDPSVLPEFPVMRDAAFEAAGNFLTILWARQQGAAGSAVSLS